jgi:hypothetical protein
MNTRCVLKQKKWRKVNTSRLSPVKNAAVLHPNLRWLPITATTTAAGAFLTEEISFTEVLSRRVTERKHK